MAEAKMTIGFDDETKALIRELVDAVRELSEKPDTDQSFSDVKRLVEEA